MKKKPIPFGQDMSFHLWAHSADINAAVNIRGRI
jgi:hypothetical protein